MPDISKCVNGCEKQDKCYRWYSKPNEFRQTYADFKPDENGECEYFWERDKC